jgi:hypothetical protein
VRALSEAQHAALAVELGGPPLAWRWREDGALSVVSGEGRKRVFTPAELAALTAPAASPAAEEPEPEQDGNQKPAALREAASEPTTAQRQAERPGDGEEAGAAGQAINAPDSPELAKAPRKPRSAR